MVSWPHASTPRNGKAPECGCTPAHAAPNSSHRRSIIAPPINKLTSSVVARRGSPRRTCWSKCLPAQHTVTGVALRQSIRRLRFDGRVRGQQEQRLRGPRVGHRRRDSGGGGGCGVHVGNKINRIRGLRTVNKRCMITDTNFNPTNLNFPLYLARMQVKLLRHCS